MGYTDIKKQRGFTLIEIAIVLVIIGILLSIGTGMIGTLTKRAKLSEAREIINAALESVISYGAANNKLPDTTVFPTVIRNPNDAWTKPLYYIYDNNLTDVTIGGICGRKTTDLTICRDAACTVATNINNVAFAVISGADNYNVQTGIITAAPCPAGTCVRVYEVDTANIDDYSTDINRPEPYDDIVKWITIDELRIKAGCVGAQLRILNNELPSGFQNSSYSATVYADGGVPFSSGGYYRWCRQGVAPTGLIFNPSTLNADCSGLAEASWGQADSLAISGTPTVFGNFNITFFVRDNNDSSGTNDNIAQKAFVLTINPVVAAEPPTGCSDYRVWNNTGSRYDFTVDSVCRGTIWDNREITSAINGYLNTGEQIDRDNNSNGTCQSAVRSLTYTQAAAADTNGDCCVNFTGTEDMVCP